MNTISTGEPSNLRTYRAMALALSGDENSRVVKFFDEKIANCPHGADEEVIAHETQVLYLIMSMITGIT
jgi:hypothetical protein